MTLSIEFLSSDFCIVDKPAEMLSVPSRLGSKDPRPILGHLLEQQLGQKIWPCHRLDEDVSGLLLFALNAKAHRAANSWFEKHQIQKQYQALSEHNHTSPRLNDPQLWACRLVRGKKRAYEADFGKESKTNAKFLGSYSTDSQIQCFLWLLEPLTGRSHQLRYEMMRHLMPIVGDTLYGSQIAFDEPGIALRAVRLNFSACTDLLEYALPQALALNKSRLFSSEF